MKNKLKIIRIISSVLMFIFSLICLFCTIILNIYVDKYSSVYTDFKNLFPSAMIESNKATNTLNKLQPIDGVSFNLIANKKEIIILLVTLAIAAFIISILIFYSDKILIKLKKK